MNEAIIEAVGLIRESNHMTVATADSSGKPWSSPVFFVEDDDFNLYWVSSKTAAHSANIRARPEVAITIYRLGDRPGMPPVGVYVDGEALELEDEEDIRQAIAVLRKKRQSDKFEVKGPENVTGDAAWRIYKAVPREVYRRADASESGQAVTERERIQLRG